MSANPIQPLGDVPLQAEASGPQYALGEWWWVCDGDPPPADAAPHLAGPGTQLADPATAEPGPPSGRTGRLACVMEVGSNYVLLHAPRHSGGYSTWRLHFDKAWKHLEREHHPEQTLQRYQALAQQAIKKTLRAIETATARLGLSSVPGLSHTPQAEGNALLVLSATPDLNAHKAELLALKDAELPALYESLQKHHGNLSMWMNAVALPLSAQAKDMKATIRDIDARVLTLSLYAGLAEQVVTVREGEPAPFDTKLHVMQQRLYMDEECLADYRHGGMDFSKIEEFDDWLSHPNNFERVLPHPRCVVAMRVRRNTKDRSALANRYGQLGAALLRMELEQQDKLTFLYLRNGEQLHRLNTELEFGDLIFSSRADFDPREPRVYKVSAFDGVEKSMPAREYEERLRQQADKQRLYDEWKAANPDAHQFDNPHRLDALSNYELRDWHPFDQSSVYYDTIAAHLSDQIQHYNRIAVLIQGLFDRSLVFHPHPPVQTWTASGFDAAITLVYDGSDVLHDGEAPDFEAYRARCNASLTKGSLTVGQELFWLRAEAEKETARRRGDWRMSEAERFRDLTVYQPYGNPGPGYLARIEQWRPRARSAVYRWERERRRWTRYADDAIACTIAVPASALFNVSAYKLGDYKQFFQDRRTRPLYLKWAPMLLAAEEYHAQQEKAAPAP